MSLQISVMVRVSEADDSVVYVNVLDVETVLPAAPPDSVTDALTQRDVDIVDLARVALERIADDVVGRATSQTEQLRGLLAGLVE